MAWNRARGDRGASAVELALVLPFLALVICGIIEFGWAYSQMLALRHGARETARLVAVDYRTTPTATGSIQSDEIVAEGCRRMDHVPGTSMELLLPGASTAAGGTAEIEVNATYQPITGMLNFALGGKVLHSKVQTRLEQPAQWSATTSPEACP